MKKWNKTIVLSVCLASAGVQQNLYAGFFDKLTSDLQRGLTGQARTTTQAPKPAPQPEKVTLPVAYVKKGSNIRSGPGTSNAKVGHLPQGTAISIVSTEGNWLQMEAQTANGLVEGWIYKPLVTMSVATVNQAALNNEVNTIGKANKQNIFYAGYSKEFQKVKIMMAAGDLKGVDKFYTEREATVLEKNQTKWQAMEEIGLLRWMERGTLYLDEGNLDNSIKSFGNAEDILNARQQESHASGFLTSITSFAAETATGNEEFQAYPGEGYEKVLMLNYKSISYLLDGKRQAYNVARRAIDWQNLEKAQFQDKIKAAKKEAKEQKANEQAKATEDEWSKSYKKLDKIATRVPSAFINPFGYYVTGMIQEFESKDDRSLRDNARIAYKKALDLNPKSKVLKQAVSDMKNKKSYGNKRLLHIVVGDGFVPEKKMLIYNFSAGGSGVVPIKLPIYEPVSTKVARIEVQTSGGKRLARLSPVADIEAICLRHQKDTEAFRSLRMTLAITRAVGVNQASKNLGIFGNLLSSSVNDMAAPDMRSWMSLPATLLAARLHVSKNIKSLKIVSFDARGRRLASQKVKLSGKSDAFVYARSINKQLYVHGSNSLWTAN